MESGRAVPFKLMNTALFSTKNAAKSADFCKRTRWGKSSGLYATLSNSRKNVPVAEILLRSEDIALKVRFLGKSPKMHSPALSKLYSKFGRYFFATGCFPPLNPLEKM